MRRDRAWVAALLLPLLLLRAFVPGGFMPVASSGGRLLMELCAGDGASAQLLELPAGTLAPVPDGSNFPVPLDSHVGHDTLCPFAASVAAAPPPTQASALVAQVTFATDLAFFPEAPAQPAIWRAHSPRGPPSLV